MKEKWTTHIIAVSVIVVFIVLGLACASTPEPAPKAPEFIYTEVSFSEFREKVRQVDSPGQGFIVEVYFNATNAPGEGSFSIGENPILNPMDSDRYWIRGHNHNLRGYDAPYSIYADYLQFEQYDNQTYKRIDKNKPYRIYVSVHNVFSDTRWTPIIDRIEGLRSLEEVAAIEAREREEREAAEEARRQERAEARRRVQENLIIGPSNFNPAIYTKVDLFEAVATSERLQATLRPGEYEEFDIFGVYTRNFVSDVIFVSQNGTDITFRTEDNAISRRMKVDSRTSLIAGQKVRVYYGVYRIRDWRVDAIERL